MCIRDRSEIDVVMRAEHAEIATVRIIVVITHAAIARYAAVHLVIDERPEFLVLVGTFGEAVAARVLPGHHRHVLQMAMTSFLAHRAIVRMIDHQPFDHALAKLLRLGVRDLSLIHISEPTRPY